MMFLFKRWRERLYTLDRSGFKDCVPNADVELVPITESNARLVGDLRSKEYISDFYKQLRMGDFGYYAYVDGAPVGYGWVKRTGSDDYFFRIGDGAAYLCRFFTSEAMSGKGIYPYIVSSLIKHERNVDRFYIAAESGNDSSARGLMKVGFEPVGEYVFTRIFKHTLNKRTLSAGAEKH